MKKKWAALLLCILLTFALPGCGAKAPATDGLVGTWQDTSGLTEYRFDEGGKMRMHALSLGSFKGTYHLEGDRITLHYRVLTKDVNDTYTVKVSGDNLYLGKSQFKRKK